MTPEVYTTEATVCTNYVNAAASPLTFEQALTIERRMLDSVGASAARGESKILTALWQTEQAIILPSGMSQKHNVITAANATKCRGWPAHERHTGGDVTPQFDGVLNISMSFLLKENECNIMTAYERLTDPIIAYLRISRGISAYLSSVTGAFCDGAHNIVVDGKKLGGTAQRWRRLKTAGDEPQVTVVLGHIALLCGGALDTALDASNLFFKDAGIPRRIDPTVHVTMADLDNTTEFDLVTLAAEIEASL